VRREAVVLGGAGNVARNIVSLGAACGLCAVVGDDLDGRSALDLVKELDIDPAGIVIDDSRPTTRKTRVVARGQQVVRFDRESEAALTRTAHAALALQIDRALPSCSASIAADYGKGVFGGSVGRKLGRSLCAAAPAYVDPKSDLAAFRGARLVKPNAAESQRLAGRPLRGAEDSALAATRIASRLPGADVVVTRGGEGMTVIPSGGVAIEVPTPRREVFDVQGAGDTAIAALALALQAGASLREAAVISNAASGAVVAKSGTATATPDELRDLLPAAIAAAEALDTR
jgi:D-beta-D-heptose 7-phosphate kinase/D-beta-D-heptose 1-phosphate adenosyltransferase